MIGADSTGCKVVAAHTLEAVVAQGAGTAGIVTASLQVAAVALLAVPAAAPHVHLVHLPTDLTRAAAAELICGHHCLHLQLASTRCPIGIDVVREIFGA